MVSEERGLPDSFDPATGKNVKWVARLGNETHGTPTVAGGRVYIGTNNGEPRDSRQRGDRGVMMCFDERDGRFLWQLVVPKIGGDVYLDWPRGGMVGPATIEGERVYTVTNRDEVVALDAQGMANGNDGPYRDESEHQTPKGTALIEAGERDGDILWMCDLEKEVGIYHHDAAHSSPLLYGDYLYVNSSNGVDNTHRKIRKPDAPSLVVIDKRSGRVVAQDAERIGPRVFHCTWSSPALGEVNGRPLVFFGGGDGVVYAFETVQEAAGGGIANLRKVWWFDCDPSGPKEDVHKWVSNRRESPSNIKSMPVFAGGRLYVTVGGDIWWGKRQGWIKCIDPSKTGDVTRIGEIWSYEMKQTCSTVAVSNGLVYAADCGGQIHCVDAATGKGLWVHQVEGEIWASPMVADGKVYIGTCGGQFLIFAEGREKKVLSSIQLDDRISATATIANGVVYVATWSKMYAISK